MKVIKRDGRSVDYDASKIKDAIEKANLKVQEEGGLGPWSGRRGALRVCNARAPVP